MSVVKVDLLVVGEWDVMRTRVWGTGDVIFDIGRDIGFCKMVVRSLGAVEVFELHR
jgi:hypothetical protein